MLSSRHRPLRAVYLHCRRRTAARLSVRCVCSPPQSSNDAATPSSLPPIAVAPWAADSALAGLGLWGSISMLGALEPVIGQPLFLPAMAASGIIFFVGTEPPKPSGFLSGTLCSATLSLATITLLSQALPPVAAQGGAAAVLLVWYKATHSLFPPAAALAGLLSSQLTYSSAARPSFIILFILHTHRIHHASCIL